MQVNPILESWKDRPEMTIVNSTSKFQFDYLKYKNLPTGKFIGSPTFTAGGHDWSLQFYPQGVEPEYGVSHVAVYLMLESEATREFSAKCTFQVLNKKGEFITVNFHEIVTFTEITGMWGTDDFIARDTLEKYYCVNGVFVISCTIRVFDEYSSPLTEPIIVQSDPGGLCEHIEKLWGKRETFDVTFEVEGQSISAHRIMLAARSPVFEAELFGSMAEAKMERVKIDEMKAEVFKALLHFVYTDQLANVGSNGHPLSVELLQGLFVAADRYGLNKLTLLCEDQLEMNLAVDTVVTTLLLADRHNRARLKKKCLDYASSPENFLLVALTEGYLNIMPGAPSLLVELSEMVKSSSCLAKKQINY